MPTTNTDPNLIGFIRATGDPGMIGQPIEIEYDPVRGVILHESWEGVGDNPAMASWAQIFFREKIGFRWKRSGHISRFEINYSGDAGQASVGDSAQANWQLLGNIVQRSIYKSPFAMAIEAGDPGALAFIRSTYSTLIEEDAESAQTAVNALPAGDIKVMLNYLLQGTTHFDVCQPVLKYSGSISNFYLGDVATSDTAMLNIWLTADLLSAFAIPPFESRRISQFVAPAAVPRYQWGWLQLGTTLTTDAQNRKSVSTEWVLDQWSTDFYAIA